MSSHTNHLPKMFRKVFFFKSLVFFLYRVISFGKLRNNGRPTLHRIHSTPYSKYPKLSSFPHKNPETPNQTLLFDLEGSLLRSSSPFPYFMLVAFEAGSAIRAIVLLLLYPLVALVSEEMGVKIMVMICFFGIRKEGFRVGSTVLPKCFLQHVGLEGFELMRQYKTKIGVTCFPRVMVESLLRDYLAIDGVVGRELRVVCGYFIGIMEDTKKVEFKAEEQVVGVSSFNKFLHHNQLFSQCKEVYIVSKADKKVWQPLPRQNYPNPLIFHDGRLAIRPDPISSLAILMWAPFGVALALLRIAIGLSLPYTLSIPMIVFTGAHLTLSKPSTSLQPKAGILYVCNHRTLLDPLYLSFAIKKELTAVTYSLSRVSELLSPIKTVRLTRNRAIDGEMMRTLLKEGDLVVCPEGTTCREPYLLRFSPLFGQMSEEIVPVAVNTEAEWFYGSTAGGFKCFDPFFFFMNPRPLYSVRILETVRGSSTSDGCGGRTRYDVANDVQRQVGEVLGFECTGLTRKDKYLVLAGNEGIVNKTYI